MKKRVCSLLLILCMVLGMMPISAFAAESTSTDTTEVNQAPVLMEGVQDLTVTVQTGKAYQLDDLINGKVFYDPDGTSLDYRNYFYRKSSDGGVTWSDMFGFSQMEHGTINSTFSNSVAGTYIYEFVAYDGTDYSTDTWTLTLVTKDVITENVKFYLSQDQNYGTHGKYPVLELYKTAGIDDGFNDYIGWFINGEGETVRVYNPQDYTIIDGEGDDDYVVIGEAKYSLRDYEKLTFTNSAFDDANTSATPSNTVDANGYNVFYGVVETGRYSTRSYGWNETTESYDVYLGGQSLKLPMEKDIYGGGGNDIYFRVISVFVASTKSDGSYYTAEDYTAELNVPVAGSNIHSGDPYTSGNYTYYPFMSWVQGNGCVYNCYVYPTDTENYIFSQSINNTTGRGTTVEPKAMYIQPAYTLTVTVPENGEYRLYLQRNNFNTVEQEAYGEPVVNGDGTKTITYKVSRNNSNYTWRLTDPTGTYVTKAGWVKSTSGSMEMDISFSEFTDKKTHDFSNLGTAVDDRDEADIQVFLSDSGFKSVSGETRIRAYRMWEIINSDPGNIMFEPDFNVQVLSGNASDFKLNSGGNALNNWIDVNPTTTDIVAVTYDAIQAVSSDVSYGESMGGLFPATNPERACILIVTNQAAGTADAQITFNGSKITDRGDEWNYLYDTWFYMDTNEAPELDFTVTGTGNVTVSYATVITNDSLKSTMSGWTGLAADADGRYNINLLPFRNAGTLGGTVIIKMTDSTGTSYRLVRVAEMKATVENLTLPGEPLTPGDQVKVTFDGLYRSVNKISGIFNPTTYYLRYTVNGNEIAGRLQQYWQMDKTELTLTIPEDITFPEGETSVDYSFTNGYIYGDMYAATSPFSSMYYITDTGVGTNFSAAGVQFVLSRLADIPVTVHMKKYYDFEVAFSDGTDVVEGATVTLKDASGKEYTPDENGVYQDLPFGDYTYTFTKDGYVNKTETFRLGAEESGNVLEGILTKTFTVTKVAAGAWDGRSTTEPAQENGVYQIGTGAELYWFAQAVNGGQKTISGELTADIDLTSCNWTPIGNTASPFGGTFDGQDHKVVNLLIEEAVSGGYGLFGNVNGAAISNLTVAGEITLNASDVGGVVGVASLTTLNNVHANVTITASSGENAGGVLGSGSGCTLTNVTNSGNISGGKYVGGIAGKLAVNGTTNSTVTNSANTGSVSGTEYVAGISGHTAKCTISGSYNAGDVNASTQYAAGIATTATLPIVNCYNTGTVSSTGNYVAGIVARVTSADVTLNNCFNAGQVTGVGTYVGSIAGQLTKADTVTENLYYLEGTHTAGIGSGKTGHSASAVSADTMASADFVATMNTGLEEAAFWKGDTHPLLTWQEGGSYEEPETVYGDMSGDGIVNSNDAAILYAILNSKATATEEQMAAADVNQDGVVNPNDAALLYAFINGKFTEFPKVN